MCGRVHVHLFDPRGREGRELKKIMNMQFLVIKTKARTVVVLVRKGEECLPCNSPDMSLQKGGSLKLVDRKYENTRRWDRKRLDNSTAARIKH